MPPPITDSLGRVMIPEHVDPWESRVGVARGLGQLPPHLLSDQCMELLMFLIPAGVSDPNSEVCNAMVDTAQTGITQHGEVHVNLSPSHSFPFL